MNSFTIATEKINYNNTISKSLVDDRKTDTPTLGIYQQYKLTDRLRDTTKYNLRTKTTRAICREVPKHLPTSKMVKYKPKHHLTLEEISKGNEDYDKFVESSIYTCGQCKSKFSDLRSHHIESPKCASHLTKCEECNLYCKGERGLKIHTQLKHKAKHVIPNNLL